MAALRSRCGHYILVLFLLLLKRAVKRLWWFLLSFLFPCLISPVAHWMSTILLHKYTWCGRSGNLECMSEMCCTRLAGNAGPKNCHLGTIAQLCRAASSQQRHVSTIEKKLLNSNMVNFGLLLAQIHLGVRDTPANFNGFRILTALLHGILVVGVSHALRG